MIVNCWAADPVERPTAMGIISDLESFGISVPPASGIVNQRNNLDFPSFLLDGTERLEEFGAGISVCSLSEHRQ